MERPRSPHRHYAIGPGERYWLSYDDGRTWQRVDGAAFREAERRAGFHSSTCACPEAFATSGFGTDDVRGKVTFGLQQP
jgi:hypothetical protein